MYGGHLAAVLEACQDLPGAEIITWQDDTGAAHPVRSEQINDALHDLCGEHVTAKTMRTWNGTLAAFGTACGDGPLSIGAMTQAAAKVLHNTPAVARDSYVHPAVIDLANIADVDRRKTVARLGAAVVAFLGAVDQAAAAAGVPGSTPSPAYTTSTLPLV